MTTNVTPKEIHAFLGVAKLTDANLAPVLNATVNGLTVNATTFPKPPVDLPTYTQSVSAYNAAVLAAINGGKTAVAQKNKLRDAAIQMYKQIAHYVEANCNDDMNTFMLSGFQAVTTAKTATAPASDTIRKIDQGPNSGQLVVTLVKDPGAGAYDLRWAPVPAGGAPTAWTDQGVPNTRPVTISGLTPGTVYAFQVRSLLKKGGYTDYSDSVTLMST